MSKNKDIFSQEIELSEIVLQKTNQAFEKIRQEDDVTMKTASTKSKVIAKSRGWKAQAAAAVGVCILAVSSISGVAAIRHYWGRGMNGNIQATDMQRLTLTEKQIAEVYHENPEKASLAVTDGGVTIEPDTVVVDERFAYMSFCISDYPLAEGAEPGFDAVAVYQGDDPQDDGAWLDMSGTMYNGIVPDENGEPMYEDGTPIAYTEEGSLICHYTDGDGNMEYIIRVSAADEKDSLLGKTVHVAFKNLGTFSKTDFTSVVEGNWDFALTLPDVSSSQMIRVGRSVEGTDFMLENIEISPISMKVNYSVGAAPAEKEDDPGIPEVKGVVLEDGTRIPYLTDGGSIGYADDNKTIAYQIAGYDRVIDVDEVAALIVLPSTGKETVEIPLSK